MEIAAFQDIQHLNMLTLIPATGYHLALHFSLFNADLPLSAKTYQLGGSQTLSFSYAGGNASCVIFAMRDSNAGIYLCDNWNHVVTAKDFANLNVSISNKTVTIQNNNTNMAISIIVLIANNMPLTQA